MGMMSKIACDKLLHVFYLPSFKEKYHLRVVIGCMQKCRVSEIHVKDVQK